MLEISIAFALKSKTITKRLYDFGVCCSYKEYLSFTRSAALQVA